MENSLLHFYNVGLYEYAKQLKDGTYEPCEWPTEATHRLVPTSWNYDKLYKPNAHGAIQKPGGAAKFALSVCAMPLTRKRRLRGAIIHIRAELPENAPAYRADGSVEGKRQVIRWMVEAMRAKVKKTFVKRATSQQLDTLYRNLQVANYFFQ
jgi:hypothetical protein